MTLSGFRHLIVTTSPSTSILSCGSGKERYLYGSGQFEHLASSARSLAAYNRAWTTTGRGVWDVDVRTGCPGRSPVHISIELLGCSVMLCVCSGSVPRSRSYAHIWTIAAMGESVALHAQTSSWQVQHPISAQDDHSRSYLCTDLVEGLACLILLRLDLPTDHLIVSCQSHQSCVEYRWKLTPTVYGASSRLIAKYAGLPISSSPLAAHAYTHLGRKK